MRIIVTTEVSTLWVVTLMRVEIPDTTETGQPEGCLTSDTIVQNKGVLVPRQ
nr:hypothetical protein [Cedecea colo]